MVAMKWWRDGGGSSDNGGGGDDCLSGIRSWFTATPTEVNYGEFMTLAWQVTLPPDCPAVTAEHQQRDRACRSSRVAGGAGDRSRSLASYGADGE